MNHRACEVTKAYSDWTEESLETLYSAAVTADVDDSVFISSSGGVSLHFCG